MKHKTKKKKKKKVFRTLVRMVKKCDRPGVNESHTPQQEKKANDSRVNTCYFSAGEFKNMR